MKILLILLTFIMLLGFQNCEVASENPEAVVTEHKLTLGDNVTHLNLFDFPDSPQTGNWNGMINEYRMDLDTGEVSYFGDGEKTNLCLDDQLKHDLIDFAENTEICVYVTHPRDNEEIYCTMEFRYGEVLFSLENNISIGAASFAQFNVNGTGGGCLTEVKFCDDADSQTLKELKEAVASTPSNSCD